MFEKFIFDVKFKFLPNLNRRLLYKYKSCAQTDGDCVDGMFPRVYSQSKFTNIELTLFSKDASFCDPEFLYNIVDKFLRVTDPNVEESKRYCVRIYLNFTKDTSSYNVNFSNQKNSSFLITEAQ